MTCRSIGIALLACAAVPALSGCIARMAYDVATAPVRIAREAADVATTSQSEADEKRGRALRRREEQLGRLERSYQSHARACERGSEPSCAQAQAERAEIDRLMPTVAVQPR